VVHDITVGGVVLEQRDEVVGHHVALAQQAQRLPVIIKVPSQEAINVSQALCTSRRVRLESAGLTNFEAWLAKLLTDLLAIDELCKCTAVCRGVAGAHLACQRLCGSGSHLLPEHCGPGHQCR
jgi:hypothetical protein